MISLFPRIRNVSFPYAFFCCSSDPHTAAGSKRGQKGPFDDRLPVFLSPVRYFAVEKGGEWSYHYKHSVQQTPVDEYFRVNGVDDMTMTHTTYESLGVGLPYDPSEGTFTSLKKDGKFDLEMNRPYKYLKFRTAVQAMPKIIHKDVTYDLCPLYGQGTLVEVKVMKRYQYWLMSLTK